MKKLFLLLVLFQISGFASDSGGAGKSTEEPVTIDLSFIALGNPEILHGTINMLDPYNAALFNLFRLHWLDREDKGRIFSIGYKNKWGHYVAPPYEYKSVCVERLNEDGSADLRCYPEDKEKLDRDIEVENQEVLNTLNQVVSKLFIEELLKKGRLEQLDLEGKVVSLNLEFLLKRGFFSDSFPLGSAVGVGVAEELNVESDIMHLNDVATDRLDIFNLAIDSLDPTVRVDFNLFVEHGPDYLDAEKMDALSKVLTEIFKGLVVDEEGSDYYEFPGEVRDLNLRSLFDLGLFTT